MIVLISLLYICCSFIVSCAQQPVVVIVPSYNNASTCIKNLESILKQDYSPLHIIYIDDCSTDSTGELIERYIAQRHISHMVTLIRNHYNRKAMANIYNAVHMCDDHALITVVDGDDALAHNHVISTIVEQHKKHDAWVSYAQYINVPEAKARSLNIPIKGCAQAMPAVVVSSGTYRKHPWCWSGLRSFYAWIFKQIRLNDLLDTRAGRMNKFYGVCCDNAYFFPLLEMSGSHALFIPEVLLLRNVDTPLNDFKVNKTQQRETALFIRSMPPYQRVYMPLPFQDSSIRCDALLIPKTSEDLLQTVERLQSLNLKTIYVIAERIKEPLDTIIQSSIPLRFTTWGSLNTLPSLSSHLLIIDGSLNVPVDLARASKELDRTFAHAYYFDIQLHHFGSRSFHDLPLEVCGDTCFAFRFNTKTICQYNMTHAHQLLVHTRDVATNLASARSLEELLHMIYSSAEQSQRVCLASL